MGRSKFLDITLAALSLYPGIPEVRCPRKNCIATSAIAGHLHYSNKDSLAPFCFCVAVLCSAQRVLFPEIVKQFSSNFVTKYSACLWTEFAVEFAKHFFGADFANNFCEVQFLVC